MSSNSPITSPSPFTSHGILVGVAEFGLVSTVARWIAVALFSDLALRLVFKRRIGLYLVVQLSVLAGMRAWASNLQRQYSPSVLAKCLTCSLFVLAFVMTRGVDLAVSNLMSSMQRSQAHRVALVAAADTTAPSMANASSADQPNIANLIQRTMGPSSAVSRLAVYHALRDITSGGQVQKGSGLWPEVIGGLSDAEVASVTLAQGERPCTSAQVGPMGPMPAPSQRWKADMPKRPFYIPFSLMSSFFGENVRFAHLVFNQTLDHYVGYSVPISSSYYVERDGRSQAVEQPRRQFGVLSMADDTLGAYDMECGLDMVDVLAWLAQRLPELDRGAATMRYDDLYFLDLLTNIAIGAFSFTKNVQDDIEVLSFGGLPGSFFNPASIWKLRPGNDGRQEPVTTSAVLTTSSGLSATCHDLPRGQYTLGLSGDARKRLESHLANKRTTADLPNQQCNITLPNAAGPVDLIVARNHPTATQVCRTKIRRYAALPQTPPVPLVFHYVSTRYTRMTADAATRASVLCMHASARTSSSLPLAHWDAKWGYLSHTTRRSSMAETRADPAAGQAVFVSLVLVPWWLLGAVLAAAVYLVVGGTWGDVAEVVAGIVYAFAFRPVPPAIGAQHRGPPPSIAHGLLGIPLTPATEFVLTHHGPEDGGTGEAHLEVRVVPRAWHVAVGDNLAQGGQGQETVVAADSSFTRLVKAARKSGSECNA